MEQPGNAPSGSHERDELDRGQAVDHPAIAGQDDPHICIGPQGTRQRRRNRRKPADADQILELWCNEKDTHGARPLDDPKVIRPISIGRFDQSL